MNINKGKNYMRQESIIKYWNESKVNKRWSMASECWIDCARLTGPDILKCDFNQLPLVVQQSLRYMWGAKWKTEIYNEDM